MMNCANFFGIVTWEQRELIDVLKQHITDGPHETPRIMKEGIPFISVEAIVNNKIDFKRKRGYISNEYNEKCNQKYKPQKNDVYLVKSGSTVGKTAIVETNIPFNIWSPLAALRPNNKTSPYFLFYLLQTDNLQSQVINKSKGGTQPNLSMRLLEHFKIFVPNNIDCQTKIARLLIKVDKVISLQQRKLKLIKVELSAILQQLLSQKSTWPNYKLSQVVSIQDNKRVPVKRQDRISGPIPYYGANGVQDYVDGYTHKGDLILIAEDGANSLTNYPIYFVNGKIWANNHTHVLRPNKEVNPLFLTVTLKQINYSKYVVGGSRYKLNLEDLKSIKLNIPNRAQQDKIGGIYNKFYQVQLKENHKLKLLHKIKHFLLQNMFI